MSRFTRLLIANRGEIACRIIATARRMGFETVAVHSTADAEARHVHMADLAVEIGPPAAARSYLLTERIIDAARRAGADAVHPGYGFLSENADFAQACLDAGLVFIGPSPDAIRAMGSKRAAKERVAAHGVPVLPGYSGADQEEATLLREAERIGLPLMVKASAGGGGKGLRLVTDGAELAPAITRARAEAQAVFGDGELILERALIDPRHVEIQVFGDSQGRIIHLGERDCSVQRRHQKVIEEAPSPAVGPDLRAEMGRAAVAAAASVGYVGAGTVEFLLDAEGRFYFMEMNTRLQVEHPVTEMVTGLDLVEWQLRVAAGEPLPLTQDDIRLTGHAMEARLYAEDPYDGFLPQTGRVTAWHPATGEGVRVDHGLRPGAEVGTHYDPLLAKVIAHGRDREEALRRLIRALDGTVLHGVTSNKSFLRQILADPAFADGAATTGLIGAMTLTPPPMPAAAVAIAAALLAGGEAAPLRTHGTLTTRLRLGWPGGEGEVAVTPVPEGLVVALADSRHIVRVTGTDAHAVTLVIDGVRRTVPISRDADGVTLDLDGVTHRVTDRPLGKAARAGAAAPDTITAPMPGTVVDLAVQPGDRVGKGQRLLVMEAMKMQLELKAPAAGTVAEVAVAPGRQVPARALLVRLTLDP